MRAEHEELRRAHEALVADKEARGAQVEEISVLQARLERAEATQRRATQALKRLREKLTPLAQRTENAALNESVSTLDGTSLSASSCDSDSSVNDTPEDIARRERRRKRRAKLKAKKRALIAAKAGEDVPAEEVGHHTREALRPAVCVCV